MAQAATPACFFNLEQLGDGGAATSADYLRLLHGSAVVDYDTANVAAYCADPADVPVVPLLHAPYLDDGRAAALEERPIDLLFFGSVNPRRRTFIERIERCGISVSMFDLPIYGEERDHFIRQAKARCQLPLLRLRPLRAGARCRTVCRSALR